MERASAPGFKHSLVRKWIAAMPQVEAKLRSGGTAVDIGCGSGLASVILAKAFPKATFFGYDPHGPSIEWTQANAREGAGLGSEFGEAVLRDLARKSGFSQFKKLRDSSPLEAYYELRA